MLLCPPSGLAPSEPASPPPSRPRRFPHLLAWPLGCELQAVLTLALPAEWDLWENVLEIPRCSVLSFLTSVAPDVPGEVVAACSSEFSRLPLSSPGPLPGPLPYFLRSRSSLGAGGQLTLLPSRSRGNLGRDGHLGFRAGALCSSSGQPRGGLLGVQK